MTVLFRFLAGVIVYVILIGIVVVMLGLTAFLWYNCQYLFRFSVPNPYFGTKIQLHFILIYA